MKKHRAWRRAITAAVATLLGLSVALAAANTADATPEIGNGLVATTTEVLATRRAPSSVADLDCLTAEACIAAADPALRTVDGGLSWQPMLPADSQGKWGGALQAIECTSAWCVATQSGTIVRSIDGGTTWAAVPLPNESSASDLLTCTDDGFCLAGAYGSGGQRTVRSSNGGASWSARPGLLPNTQVDDLACGSPSWCVVVSQSGVLTSVDGGATWVAPANAPAIPFTAVACPTAGACLAVSYQGWALLTAASAIWNPAVPNGWFPQGGIACPTNGSCVIAGMSRSPDRGWLLRVDNGGTLVDGQLLPETAGPLTAIDCHGTACVGVGLATMSAPTAQPSATSRSTDGGSTWATSVVQHQPVEWLEALTCTATGACLVAGDTGWRSGGPTPAWSPSPQGGDGLIKRTTDGGSTWTNASLPAGVRRVRSIDCSINACVAAADSDGTSGWWHLLRSTDDGATWTLTATPTRYGELPLVECVVDTCFAAAQPHPIGGDPTTIMRSDATGGNWSIVAKIPDVALELFCLDADRCLATGTRFIGGALRTTDGGLTWSPVTIPSGAFELDIQGCVRERCFASALALPRAQYFSDDLGRSWSPYSQISAEPAFFACGATRCFTTGWYPVALVADSAGFTAAPTQRRFTSRIPRAFDCISDDTCLTLVDGGSLGGRAIERISIAASPLIAVTPWRFLETRSPGAFTVDSAHMGVGIRPAGSTYVLPMRGRGEIAASASAVTVTVTVTEPREPGFVTVYPCDRERPNASNLNYAPGQTVANSVTVPLATDGTICLYTHSTTHLLVDANAYVPSMVPSITSVQPARLLETRLGPELGTTDGREQGAGAVGAGEVRALPVRGRGGVPDDATTVTLNVGAVDPTGPGYLTVYPCDRTRPNASNVNYGIGRTASNAVTVPLASDGTVCVYSLARTDVIVDVNAYVGPNVAGVAAVEPARLLDSRSGAGLATTDGRMLGIGMLRDRQRIVLPVAGRGGVPADARTVTLTATVTQPTGPGYLTVSPCPPNAPDASNVNYQRDETVANAVTVPLVDGNVCIDVLTATHVVVDVNGYSL